MDKEIKELKFSLEDVERYKDDYAEYHAFMLLDEFILYLLNKNRRNLSHYSINRKEIKEWTQQK